MTKLYFWPVVVHFCVITILRESGVILYGFEVTCSRTKYGVCNCLMHDLQVHAEDKLKDYIYMDLSTFEELFSLVEWMIAFV